MIAGEQLGRRVYGLEISPAYCDVIVKRWLSLGEDRAVLRVRDGVEIDVTAEFASSTQIDTEAGE
jgi:DNA modification methylase